MATLRTIVRLHRRLVQLLREEARAETMQIPDILANDHAGKIGYTAGLIYRQLDKVIDPGAWASDADDRQLPIFWGQA